MIFCRSLFVENRIEYQESFWKRLIQVMNRLKAIYRSRAIKCVGSSVYQTSKREFWLDKLTEFGLKFRTELLFQELETITELRKQAKKQMRSQARKHPDFRRLCKIPGLGLVNV